MNQFILSQQNPWWKDGKFPFKIFPRAIVPELIRNLKNDKILALIGSRQVGKTSILQLLIKHLLTKISPLDIYYFNIDDFEIRALLETPSAFLQYLRPGKATKYICIDEIQRLDNPGIFLKTIFDLKANIKIIVSGSSQLEIRAKLKEFLVGRMRQFEIPRLTLPEVKKLHPNIPRKTLFQEMLLYGSYPEVVKQENREKKKLILHDIYQAYLQKDVSDFAKIDDINAFNKLLILLAAQIGGLVNIHSLSSTLKISSKSVQRYLDILEGTFIIKRLFPFFQKYSKEISKMPKVYFLDLGLRNFIVDNWQDFELRQDKGSLFENFVFLERYGEDWYKKHRYYFWRTTNQTEIDLIIQDGQRLEAIEAKYDRASTPKSFQTFKKYYPQAITRVVTHREFE